MLVLDLATGGKLIGLAALEARAAARNSHQLDPSVPACMSGTHIVTHSLSTSCWDVGIASAQGFRASMEDTYAVDLCLDSRTGMLAVFDGHGGDQCAVHCSDHLVSTIKATQGWEQGDLRSTLGQAFLALDRELMAGPCGATGSGTTGTVALLQGARMVVAGVGDSKAVLLRGGRIVPMTVDHRPNAPKEEARIRSAGGFVHRGRVNACLNISRALGDVQFKQDHQRPPCEQQVSPEPDVREARVTATSDFLLVCSDGVWNSMRESTVLRFVRGRLQQGMTPAKVCEQLCEACLEPCRTAYDNITAILCTFTQEALDAGAEVAVLGATGAVTANTSSDPELSSTGVAATSPGSAAAISAPIAAISGGVATTNSNARSAATSSDGAPTTPPGSSLFGGRAVAATTTTSSTRVHTGSEGVATITQRVASATTADTPMSPGVPTHALAGSAATTATHGLGGSAATTATHRLAGSATAIAPTEDTPMWPGDAILIGVEAGERAARKAGEATTTTTASPFAASALATVWSDSAPTVGPAAIHSPTHSPTRTPTHLPSQAYGANTASGWMESKAQGLAAGDMAAAAPTAAAPIAAAPIPAAPTAAATGDRTTTATTAKQGAAATTIITPFSALAAEPAGEEAHGPSTPRLPPRAPSGVVFDTPTHANVCHARPCDSPTHATHAVMGVPAAPPLPYNTHPDMGVPAASAAKAGSAATTRASDPNPVPVPVPVPVSTPAALSWPPAAYPAAAATAHAPPYASPTTTAAQSPPFTSPTAAAHAPLQPGFTSLTRSPFAPVAPVTCGPSASPTPGYPAPAAHAASSHPVPAMHPAFGHPGPAAPAPAITPAMYAGTGHPGPGVSANAVASDAGAGALPRSGSSGALKRRASDDGRDKCDDRRDRCDERRDKCEDRREKPQGRPPTPLERCRQALGWP